MASNLNDICELKDCIRGGLHQGATLATPQMAAAYQFAPRGLLKTRDGSAIAGLWLKGRKNKRHVYLFTAPIPVPGQTYVVEHRDVVVAGRVYENVPVKVYPPVRSLLSWKRGEKPSP